MKNVLSSGKKIVKTLRENSFIVMYVAVVLTIGGVVLGMRQPAGVSIAKAPSIPQNPTKPSKDVAGASTIADASTSPADIPLAPNPTPRRQSTQLSGATGAEHVVVMAYSVMTPPNTVTPPVLQPTPDPTPTPTPTPDPTPPPTPTPLSIVGPSSVTLAAGTSTTVTLSTSDGSSVVWQPQQDVLLPDGTFITIGGATPPTVLFVIPTGGAAVTAPSITFQITATATAGVGSHSLYMTYNNSNIFTIQVTVTAPVTPPPTPTPTPTPDPTPPPTPTPPTPTTTV